MKNFTTLLLSFVAVYCHAQTTRQEKNISAFAKLYGYIRYFHPTDEASSINWNEFAIYGSYEVLNAKSDNELMDKLRQLFLPIAPSIQIGAHSKFNKSVITPDSISNYKNIFWLHKGVGLSENSVYKSIRTNRLTPNTTRNNGSFAPFMTTIDATPYRGNEVMLKGNMKAEVEENGTGNFWLRIDKKAGSGFFYNMQDKPVVLPIWKEYSFTGKVDDDADKIVFGGFLNGKGKIDVGYISLYVRKDSSEGWKELAIQNNDFSKKQDGKLPANWYFNSSEGKYKYQIATMDNKKVLELSSVDASKSIEYAKDYNHMPKPGEVLEKNIAPNIKVIFPISLYGTSDYTFPKGNSDSLAQLKTNVKNFITQNPLAKSKDLYLGDVVIAWNIFKHFFPYWNDASQNADQILQAAITKASADTDMLSFKHTLQLMTSPLNDGHIFVSLSSDHSSNYQVPIQFALVQNKIVVANILDSSLHGIRKGDVLQKIDGRPAVDVYQDGMKYLSGSNQWKSYNAVQRIGLGAKNSNTQLEIVNDGKTATINIPKKIGVYDARTKYNSLRRKSEMFADGIFYLDLNTISKDTIDQWKVNLANAKGIICDLRGYPNGNHNLINYLMDKPEQDKWMFVPKTAYPDGANIEYMSEGWNLQPSTPHFKGKVVFIADGRAISYAESYMGYIKDRKLATIIGEPTAGTNGNINPFSLPGGYYISWTGMLMKNHDGTTHHLKGIQPDIYVAPTIAGIAAGKDELFDKALNIIQASNVK